MPVPTQPPRPAVASPLLEEFRVIGLEVAKSTRRGDRIHVEVDADPEAFALAVRERIPGTRLEVGKAEVVVRRAGDPGSIHVTRFVPPAPVPPAPVPPVEPRPVARAKPRAPAIATPVQGPSEIVLILDDVGYLEQPLVEAASIEVPVSFAIIPGTPLAREAAELLTSRGFELLCHLPMEPVGYPGVSPGEGAVLVSMSSEQVREATLRGLASVPGARGVNNHMGSRATADARIMRDVLTALPPGIYFIDSRTSGRSKGADLARELKIPTASRDVFLDVDPRDRPVRAQIEELARIASVHGRAIGIGHMYEVTIRALREEIPRLQARGFRFIRASEAVH